jgi:hypothetical protein
MDAVGIDFAGVDLLPTDQGWVVLELNGAVDFDNRYALHDVDPFAAILRGLEIPLPEGDGAVFLDTRTKTNGLEEAMTKSVHGKPPQAGDEIVITGHAVGDASRTAVILEVLGEPEHQRFRVRWEDGHESIFFPAGDAVVHRPAKRGAKTNA